MTPQEQILGIVNNHWPAAVPPRNSSSPICSQTQHRHRKAEILTACLRYWPLAIFPSEMSTINRVTR